METFGKKLRQFRIKSNLTQSEVAKKIGISSSTYRDWEYGRKAPVVYLVPLAETFACE